ncbi:hypothetical protein DV738_g3540, partial [Chaetothyriales sp. CBS 135597]
MPPTVTKPVLPPLQTPKTASFPSEIVETPLSACVSAVIKQEQDLKTPITPPTAYTDFLKALTPVLASPPTSALQRSLSDETVATKDSTGSNPSSASSSSSSSKSEEGKSETAAPTAPARRTPSALKRLRIPHSPHYSPTTCGPSPRTGLSSISSAIFSPFSPADWRIDSTTRKHFDAPRSACAKQVSVRSVVTRTVTYKRSPPLDPAPKGKKRKLDEPATNMPPPSASTTPPATTVA